jgi:acetyl-CoA acetyltransferase
LRSCAEDPVVIVGYARTPMGGFQGMFAGTSATQLGSVAVRGAVERAGDDVNLFEVNEAFAVVAMIAAQELGIPDDKLNVNGGTTALGHPIGASGARIVATLLGALQTRGLRRD